MTRTTAALLLATCVLGPVRFARADASEDKAVKLVKKLGGYVSRDDRQPGKPLSWPTDLTKNEDPGSG